MRLDRRSCSPLQVTVTQPTLRTLRLTFDGELDAAARPLLDDVAGAVTLASPGDVEVDAAGLSFVDLRGLRALGDLWAGLERAGRVKLVRSSRAVERLLLACVRAGLPVPLPAAARRPSLPGVDPSALPPAPATRPSALGAPALLLSDGPPLVPPTRDVWPVTPSRGEASSLMPAAGPATESPAPEPPAGPAGPAPESARGLAPEGRAAFASLDLLALGPVPGADTSPAAAAASPDVAGPAPVQPLASLDLLGLTNPSVPEGPEAEPDESPDAPASAASPALPRRVTADHPSVRSPRPKLRRRVALDHPSLLPPLDEVLRRIDRAPSPGPTLPGGRVHRSEAVRSRCRHGR